MTISPNSPDSLPTILCRACGLCCSGHLFIWVKLRPAELNPAEALGMRVYRNDPTQRGFNQPCQLWQGQCSIYTSRHYPHACRAYKCKLLKEVVSETRSLDDALALVIQARGMIGNLAALLALQPGENFRERLVSRIENPPEGEESPVFRQKAEDLLRFYAEVFGVNDLLSPP